VSDKDIRILVVDDDLTELMLMRAVLQKPGFVFGLTEKRGGRPPPVPRPTLRPGHSQRRSRHDAMLERRWTFEEPALARSQPMSMNA
jgi:hypothetical protein